MNDVERTQTADCIGYLQAVASWSKPESVIPVPVTWLRLLLAAQSDGAERHRDLTAKQVADMVGRAPSTIRSWLGQGLVPGAYRLRGREWRIPRAGLKAMLGDDVGSANLTPADPTIVHGRDLSAWRRYWQDEGSEGG